MPRASSPLTFTITHRCRASHARLGVVQTPHGSFETPAFMPVGTRGTIRGLTPAQIRGTGSQIVLNNAYHLMLRPGDDLIARRGGVHAFMRWDGPILTDSGGYQAYSMSDINAIDEDGVLFKSIIDGAMVHLGPERSIEVQNNLGADIIMAFDDCPPSAPGCDPRTLNETRKGLGGSREMEGEGDMPRSELRGMAPGPEDSDMRRPSGIREPRGMAPGVAPGTRADPLKAAGMPMAPSSSSEHRERLALAHERTVRWLERCVRAHRRPEEQALFGIVQGGTDLDLRRASVEAVCNVELPGYAIGGVAVGEGPEQIDAVVSFTAPLMPDDKPRYLMGVGYERDLVAAVRAGVDMFDCVLPTRNGRNACAFTRCGPIKLRNAAYAEDDSVIEPGCDCEACSGIPGGAGDSGGGSGGGDGSLGGRGCVAHASPKAARHGTLIPESGGPGGRGVRGVRGFSRAYLRHLFMAGEMLGPTLVSVHNIRHLQRLMLDIRRAIRDDAWPSLVRAWPVLQMPAVRETQVGMDDASRPGKG